MTTLQTIAEDASKVYDNNGQYTRKGILRYEKVFGRNYISTGGPETTDALVTKLGPKLARGVRVLDVGSGIGGAAFYLAHAFGAEVVGVDLSPEMVDIAKERAEDEQGGGKVSFYLADIMEVAFEPPFDVAWSRDALMHIPDKPALFARLFGQLAPGGHAVITDYARGAGDVSPAFLDYIGKTGYHVVDPASYGKLLEGAGFARVDVEDATDQFVDILERECARLEAARADFVGEFSEADLNYILERWRMKVGFCKAGDMKWGIYHAVKPA